MAKTNKRASNKNIQQESTAKGKTSANNKKGAALKSAKAKGGDAKQQKAKKTPLGRVNILITTAILFAAGLLLPRIAGLFPEFTQLIYTECSFVVIRAVVGYFPSLVDFSVTALFGWLLFLIIVVAIVIIVAAIIKRRFSFKRFLSALCVVLFIAAILLNVFNVVGGINYYNLEASERFELTVKNRSKQELFNMCCELADLANELRTQVSVDENGIFSIDKKEYLKLVAVEVENSREVNPCYLKIRPAKAVLTSKTMSSLGLSGIYMPFFAEANINVDQPSLFIPVSAAHEYAHSLGFARENDAGFAAFLVCNASSDVNIRYSGLMLALTDAAAQLAEQSPELYKQLVSIYSKDIVADIKNYNDYFYRYDGFVSDVSSKTNDAYLKFNGSKSGEGSYGESVDLIIAYYYKNGASF